MNDPYNIFKVFSTHIYISIIMFIILVTCGSCRFCLRGNYEVCNQSAIYGFSPKVLLCLIHHHNNWRILWMVQKFLNFIIISSCYYSLLLQKVSGGNGSVHDLHTKFKGPPGARKCWSNFGCLCRGNLF